MPATSEPIKECMLCFGALEMVLPLAPTPPANELLEQPAPDQELYPLNLVKCVKCNHLQLDCEISKFRLFKNYVFTSHTSASNYSHFNNYAREMQERFNPRFTVDIGSNDGLFLHFMKERNSAILGVEPASNIAEIARQNGVETMNSFFNDLVATQIKTQKGCADLITANNVMAHNRNLGEIISGVKTLLAPDGVFVVEVAYGMTMLRKNLFDLLYHEHIHTWCLTPAVRFFQWFGLEVFDAEIVPTHGGSLRLYIRHEERDLPVTARMVKLLIDESQNFNKELDRFKVEIPKVRDELRALLGPLKAAGKHIAILGYPAKACTLSYYFGLDQYINAVYDNNTLKIGKYTHQGIKISPETHIYKNKPDYLLLLAWNYADEIINRHSLHQKTGGKFIIPFPNPKVL